MVSRAAQMGIQQVSSERAALVSNRESEEKGDLRLAGSPESKAIRTADAQAARAAGVSDVKAAQDLNPNKHNGSAGGDQLESIQIIALDDGGVYEVVKPDQVVLQGYVQYQENEWEGFNKLDPKQQREIIEAFGKASNIAQDSYKNQIQAVADSVPQGFYNVGKGLYDSAIAAGTFMIEAVDRPEKIPEAAQKLADHLSAAIMSGVKVSQVIAGYSQEVAQSGDYSRPLRDLQTVTTLANEHWEAMPLEKRTEKASELVAEMGVGSVIGAADRLARSGKLIDALEDLAQYAKDLTAPGREKARQALAKLMALGFMNSCASSLVMMTFCIQKRVTRKDFQFLGANWTLPGLI